MWEITKVLSQWIKWYELLIRAQDAKYEHTLILHYSTVPGRWIQVGTVCSESNANQGSRKGLQNITAETCLKWRPRGRLDMRAQKDPNIRDKRTWIVVARDSSTCIDVAQAGVHWRNILFARMPTSLKAQERHCIKLESCKLPSIPNYVFSNTLPAIFLKFVSLPRSSF
jgi:hypothetical protein